MLRKLTNIDLESKLPKMFNVLFMELYKCGVELTHVQPVGKKHLVSVARKTAYEIIEKEIEEKKLDINACFIDETNEENKCILDACFRYK